MKLFYNKEIEEVIIGAIMLEPNSIHKIVSILRPEHFYTQINSKIYQSCLDLLTEGITIDYLQIFELLKKRNVKIEPYKLAEMSSKVASSKQIEYHSKITVELYLKRQMYRTAQQMQIDLNNGKDVADIKDFMYSKLIDFSEIGHKKNSTHISDVIEDIAKEQASFYDKVPEIYDSKLKNLNRYLTLNKSDLVILAARPSVGKTAFALQLSINYSKTGKKVAFYSLEMSKIQLGKRIAASECLINSKGFDDLLSDRDLSNFDNNIGKLKKLPFWIDDTANMTILELRARLTELHIKEGIEIAFVDYLQLMSGSGSGKGIREQEISTISRGLKILAKELNIPIVALSQLNRSVEMRSGDKKPQLSDLRESGAIEQDADIVLFIHRPEMVGITTDAEGNSLEGYTEIVCAKYRNGGLFTSELKFKKEYQKFYDYSDYIDEDDPFINEFPNIENF